MITRDQFALIDKEIKESLQKTLNDLKTNSLHNYIIYLADGEYKPEYENSSAISNPYVIDNRVDHYKDLTRLDFLVNFLKNYYSFPSGQTLKLGTRLLVKKIWCYQRTVERRS